MDYTSKYSINRKRFLDCFCQQKVSYENEQQMKDHIRNCQFYKKESPFFKYYNSLVLRQLPEEHLVAIRCEFLNYIDDISSHLAAIGYVLPNPPIQQQQVVNAHPPHFLNASMLREPQGNLASSMMMSSRVFVPPPRQFTSEQVVCQMCLKGFDSNFDCDKIYYLNSCLHVYCKGCLIKQINLDYPNLSQVTCKVCAKELVSYDYHSLVGKEKFEVLETKAIQKMYNLVACTKCKAQFEFQPGNSGGQNVRDGQGQLLSKDLQKHYAENRFVCQNLECKTEQCKGCQTTPYHLAYDCERYRNHKESKRCRYCDDQILAQDKNQPLALQDICAKEECEDKKKYTCTKVNNCNHPCYGLKDELNCMPCLHVDCAKDNTDLMENNADEYCNICWSEALSSGPCVQLGCRHIFHFHCLKKRLEIKWIGARIGFNYCFCPLCKTWMEFSLDCELNSDMQKNLVLYENIKKKSLDRLKFEERMKDTKLIEPSSPYYQQPQEYSMAIYAYFMCCKCKKPYFGGLKDCARGLEEDKREFDPKELVCANCCEIPVENCAKHGKDNIEFKCKFCCNVAQWFCWGTTHFCDGCHKRQCNNDYVSKYPKDKLPKCPGGTQCPVGGDHKPNGEETSLGCSLCRNARDNQREF